MLTLAQNAAIKADIAANIDLSVIPAGSDGSFEIARLYNLPAAPAYMVWRTNALTKDIFDAIDWTKYTPADAPEATGIYTARAMAIQTKQMNLQNILTGRDQLDTSKPSIRAGLRDAVIQLPAGANGANISAGGGNGATAGVTVLTACTRAATRIEKLLSTSPPAAGTVTGPVTAGLLGFEGVVTYPLIEEARK